jgi:hypothetical protein
VTLSAPESRLDPENDARDLRITWIIVVISITVAALSGRLRREPWLATAMTVVGFNAFLLGIRWAGLIGGEAATAAWLASGGMAISAEALRIGTRKPAPAGS